MEENKNKNSITRPPVVVVMGHIDHGKSTLLDYIRKTNVTEKEAGGITQRISAYEFVHKDEHGADQRITFIDTPGHEAFSKMRTRGADIADIAILVVSAEDGVKPQTLEAYKTILESKIPFIVAINKIDKPGANIEKTKIELAENEIYLENYGGKVPFALVSAKVGTGVDELLSLILILAELESFTGNPDEGASGIVLEANLDSKRGIGSTLIIKNGTIKKGMTVAVEDSICPTRMMENFLGKPIDGATFSSPIRLSGWSKMPRVGAEWMSFEKKADAEKYAKEWLSKKNSPSGKKTEAATDKKIIPIVLKADVWGVVEALEKEIAKIKSDSAEFRIVTKDAGPISESDIKSIATGDNIIVIGFNVKADKSAMELAEKRGIAIAYFDIIYKMTEWLETEMQNRRPKVETMEVNGKAKIIKAFSRTKERQIVGGKVTEGVISLDSKVKIMRRDFEIGRGRIVNLEKGKAKTSNVDEGSEFGMMVESKIEIVAGDILESFSIVNK
jgi:translation initiation factor IF-2